MAMALLAGAVAAAVSLASSENPPESCNEKVTCSITVCWIYLSSQPIAQKFPHCATKTSMMSTNKLDASTAEVTIAIISARAVKESSHHMV